MFYSQGELGLIRPMSLYHNNEEHHNKRPRVSCAVLICFRNILKWPFYIK